MSIPLDRLYHYLESLSKDDIIIYRWFPHGSKKLDDLQVIESDRIPTEYYDQLLTPHLIFHDQEPLDYNYYSHEEFFKEAQQKAEKRKQVLPSVPWCYSEEFLHVYASSHLRVKLELPTNLNDYVLLCHSEKNSQELALYENNGFVGVYYWSHALIAQDWFRYAKHDTRLLQNSYKYDFLVYNRAWSGGREYRLTFAEILINNQLLDVCNTKFSATDNGKHYTNHVFDNPRLCISRQDIDSYFIENTSSSNASADYDNKDYSNSAIEVVLETLFDDTRWHLTEKALRPIACGKPFILAATPGSLQYIRSYGFKTFSGLIDETYDTITDPRLRLEAITNEMRRISALPQNDKSELIYNLHQISAYNKQLFFSEEFHNNVVGEFVSNLESGLRKCQRNMTGKWWNLFSKSELFTSKNPTTELSSKIDTWLEQHNKNQDGDFSITPSQSSPGSCST